MRYRVKVLHSNGEAEQWFLGGNDPDDVAHRIWEDEARYTEKLPDRAMRVVKILSIKEDNRNVQATK